MTFAAKPYCLTMYYLPFSNIVGIAKMLSTEETQMSLQCSFFKQIHFYPYLDTCLKNDVISFSRKRFCALGLKLNFKLELGLRLELAEARLNTFSVKRPFRQVYWILLYLHV